MSSIFLHLKIKVLYEVKRDKNRYFFNARLDNWLSLRKHSFFFPLLRFNLYTHSILSNSKNFILSSGKCISRHFQDVYWLGSRTREIGRIVFNRFKLLFTREKCSRKKKLFRSTKRQQWLKICVR